MSLVLQSSGGGQITIQEPATASNFTASLPAATGTLVVTGTTPTLNGITFPATQVPSADANTLDDYEEGTWNPIATSGSGSITSYTSAGFYTKIGRVVNLTCEVRIITAGTAGGNLDLAGAPFTNGNGFQIPTLCKELDITGSGNFMAFLLNNSTIVRIQAIGGTAPSYGNGFKYAFTLTYIA